MLKVKANSHSRNNLSNIMDNAFSKDTRGKPDKQNTSLHRSDASTESRRGKLGVTANNIALKTNVRSNKENIDQNMEKRSMSKKQANSIEKREVKKGEAKNMKKDPPSNAKEASRIEGRQTKGMTFRDVRQRVIKQSTVKKNQESITKQQSRGLAKTNSKSSKISLMSNISKKEVQNHLRAPVQRSLINSSKKEGEQSPATRASDSDSIWKYIPHQADINANHMSIEQFMLIKEMGHGSYFVQSLAVHSPTKCIFTLRTMDKASIIEQQLISHLSEAIKVQLYLSRNPRCCSGIQKLYAVFSDAINIYLVMEPVPANSQNYLLSDRIREQGGMAEEQIAYTLKTVLTSLKDIHNEGVLIRGIDANRIRNCLGVWKIVNVDQAASVRKKRRHSFMGRITQIPHQLAMGSTYSLGYDMWSIGLLLYLLATGKNPFEKDSLRRIKSLDFAFPMLLSSPLLDLLSRLLVEEPHRLNCEQSLRIPFINRQFAGRELVSREVWTFWMMN